MPSFKNDRWKKILLIAEQWREEAIGCVDEPKMFLSTSTLGSLTYDLVQLCDAEGLHIDTAPLYNLSLQIDIQRGRSDRGRKIPPKALQERLMQCVGILERLHLLGTTNEKPINDAITPTTNIALTQEDKTILETMVAEGAMTLTQEDLATMVGRSTPTIGRRLKALRENGLVHQPRGPKKGTRSPIRENHS